LSTGEEISLEQFAGRKNVVLFFYPKDNSYGCTKQVCFLRDHYPEMGRHDAVLFGVSPDGDASHHRFIAAYRLPFGLIADPDGTLSTLYRTSRYGRRPAFVRRVTFVIDKRGVIHAVAHHEFRIAKHHRKILSALRDLAHSEVG
jgi:peroxiredoxin Q/BCP